MVVFWLIVMQDYYFVAADADAATGAARGEPAGKLTAHALPTAGEAGTQAAVGAGTATGAPTAGTLAPAGIVHIILVGHASARRQVVHLLAC